MPKVTNSTLGIIVAGLVVIFGFIALLVITDHDISQYVGSITSILTLFGVGGFLNNKIDKVDKQTNGTLSKRDDDNVALHTENKLLRETLAAKTGETYTSSQDVTTPVGD